jgi:predicted short-subunit dehydrogenase-like oxidoreductase (DUF2520 family)
VRTDKPIIVIAGAGRVATQLGLQLVRSQLPVAQVLGRSRDTTQLLAEQLGAKPVYDTADLRTDADWVLLAVPDDDIATVGAQVAKVLTNALVTHTSGATPGAVLAPFCPFYGVFYPLQTFSLHRQPDWPMIPLCVDAKHVDDMRWLKYMAERLGCTAYTVSDAQRAQLHVAAVFANNFSNHCFNIAEQLLKEAALPFNMLHPLIEETARKAVSTSPAAAQTGPAIRGDMATQTRHFALLEKHPDLQQLYQLLSEAIAAGIKNNS